jgi:hypothetical protein
MAMLRKLPVSQVGGIRIERAVALQCRKPLRACKSAQGDPWQHRARRISADRIGRVR